MKNTFYGLLLHNFIYVKMIYEKAGVLLCWIIGKFYNF